MTWQSTLLAANALFMIALIMSPIRHRMKSDVEHAVLRGRCKQESEGSKYMGIAIPFFSGLARID